MPRTVMSGTWKRPAIHPAAAGRICLLAVALLLLGAITASSARADGVTAFHGGNELLACATGTDACISASRFVTPRQTGLIVDTSAGTTVTHRGVVRNFVAYDDACAAPGLCIIVGAPATLGSEATYVVVRNGRPSQPQVARGVANFNAIACPSAGRCEAVGNPYGSGQGVLVSFVDGVARRPQPMDIPGQEVLDPMAIACSSATRCFSDGDVSPDVDVPSNGVVVPITNGHVGSPLQSTGPSEFFTPRLACAPGTSTCEALGLDGSTSTPDTVPIVAGTLGPITDESASIGSPSAFACETADTCYAASPSGGGGVLLPIVDGVPGTPITVPIAHLDGLACPSPSGCVAIGNAKMDEIGNPFPTPPTRAF